jgi:ribosome recycling factor
MSDEYLEAMHDDFKSAVAHFERNLVSVRTGRASPQMLENVQVHVASYGANMPLNQLASISAPDARLLVLNPWDKTTISDIEKGILSAGMGLNPNNDGQVIRVPIPALTAERRADLERKVNQFAEDARIAARRVRREYNDTYKEMEKDKEISEDDLKRYLGTIQDATNACVLQIDGIAKAKCQEVREG